VQQPAVITRGKLVWTYWQGRIQGEGCGGMHPPSASVSVAGWLTFPYIHNVQVRNCRRNWDC